MFAIVTFWLGVIWLIFGFLLTVGGIIIAARDRDPDILIDGLIVGTMFLVFSAGMFFLSEAFQ